eukprot:2552288-Rhodomonas_salina.1
MRGQSLYWARATGTTLRYLPTPPYPILLRLTTLSSYASLLYPPTPPDTILLRLLYAMSSTHLAYATGGTTTALLLRPQFAMVLRP